MAILPKCANCKRKGRFAFKESDKVCAKCKRLSPERDEKGHFKPKQ